ncbi:BTB/POZ domain-containing protein [Ditylenchus destructor]|nr:BTB/POZ domain-containing protein [Ditylenchus destructor]
MFANIISKRALSISRMIGSQVRPRTAIYGAELKSTAKFSYSAAQKISALDFCIKREKHDGSTKDDSEKVIDYKDYVILAEAILVEKDTFDFTTGYIHNTLWMVDKFDDSDEFLGPCSYLIVFLRDILPRSETCHAEILFIDGKNSVTKKFREKFHFCDREFIKQCYNRAVVIRILEEKQKLLNEFENRWAKDVTFVVNGEKCAGDRQYLSAISPVFKKMLQDHAQDEIMLEGVESADVLKDFFLAVSSFCVQPNPTNVVALLKLAQDYDIPFLMRSCEEHLKYCYEMPISDRIILATKYNLNGLHEYVIKMYKKEYEIESETESLLQKIADKNFLEKKQKLLNEFENRWAKDVTFVVNGEKCAGDRQYLSAISPVFKKMLQDHAQDEIMLEGVESADVLKDFFLAISQLRVQPNPTNIVTLLKLAQDFDISFLMRSCEEYLKQCSEIPAIDRFLLAMKYNLSGLKLSTEKRFRADDLIKILGELNYLEQKREVLERMSNKRLSEILNEKKDILNEMGTEFMLKNIAERLGNSYCRKEQKNEYLLDDEIDESDQE